MSTNATGVLYQWFLNGNPITGATSSTYTPAVNGNYTVLVTLAGCLTSSENFSLISTSVS